MPSLSTLMRVECLSIHQRVGASKSIALKQYGGGGDDASFSRGNFKLEHLSLTWQTFQ